MKRKLQKSALWLLFFLSCNYLPALAQNVQTVRGTVVDKSTGEVFPGATVIEKGTSNGTVSDIDGNFQIQVSSAQSVLLVSFIGFIQQEIPVAGRTNLTIELEENLSDLDEVVVIGYQTVKKKDLTGATAVVGRDKQNKVTAASLGESLQGLAPGVSVRNGGGPGQNAQVEIRGVASFINSSPLYVIDGMIADANPTINTNDIETIQILKDASAAAIYGSRAANGVIIITTKQGAEGTPRVSVTAKYGIQQLPQGYQMMNNVQFAEMQRTQFANSGLTAPASVSTAFDPSVNTNWYDEVTRLGNAQDYNVTLSGGSKNSSYLISGSFFENKGVLIGHDFQRAALRINTKNTKGRVTFGENLIFTNSITNSPGTGNPFYDMPLNLPVIPVRDNRFISAANPDGWGKGTTDAVTYAWNPVAVNAINSFRSNFAKVVGNAYLDVDIMDGLVYRFNAGAELSFDHNKRMRRAGEWHFNQPAAPTNIIEERSLFSSFLLEHTVNYNKVINKHSFSGVVGHSQQITKRDVLSAGRTDLQSFDGRYLNTVSSATGDPIADGFIPVQYTIAGFLGRANYTYDDRYLITLTGRYDADSRFGSDNRSRFFPSIAGGWRISEESFFSSLVVSDLKLRASYGELGIVTVGSWDYIGFLNSNPRAIFGPDEQAYVGATQARLANPNLGWERRISHNLGFDLGLFDDQLTLSAEYYNSLSKDVLVNLPIAWYLGNLGGEPAVNAASIRNRGIEMAATYRNMKRALKWDVSANVTTIRNRVMDVGNLGEGIDYIQTGITRSQIGRPMGEWYVLKTDGIFQSDEEINNHTNSDGRVIQPFARPGDIRFVDINGDGEINQEDRTFVGSPWPTLQTGAQFNATYKNFTFNMQWIGVFGHRIMNGVRREIDSYQNTNFRADISPWTPTNTNTNDPRIGVSVGDPGLIDNARLESDRWLEDGSYVRLRNVEIGYNLNMARLQRWNVSNARLFISGQNLLTFTKYSGLDPDVTGNGILERGFDNGNWPASKIYSLGLQFEF
ncbi:SusC/RagA family TonB-linked outer membrane protein [Belliella kenyensis]|uniref:SusC/RagA family TonB-linked outer membrane protein n=1 Tax=Belliella kenyensis TaxID=1472724 RepID=A0ABV8ENL1_9BACT|nr:TonB-dependent receptor [Belliella kenyensis]MCH7403038.1 TonB-dependent receptor [Belliella kenyensis]MDN3605075.1 TonB-dependent receptor [Belliella kenyensis]